MFRIHFLPATIGDCIWIEYGEEGAPHHILLDGGTGGTRKLLEKRLKKIPVGQREIELAIVTHIDNDHIGGILRLLEEEGKRPAHKKIGFSIGDFWFNGWPQLNPTQAGVELYGVEQGERLTKQLVAHGMNWNTRFDGKAVVVPETGALPQKELPDGMVLTLLSPLPEGLAGMKEVWERELLAAGLVPGFEVEETAEIAGVERFGTPSSGILDIGALAETDFDPDGSPANRSSIALIAEYDCKRVLLAADAHADVLQAGLKRFQPTGKPGLDLFKVSHHGAQGTTSRDLIEVVDCRRYVFSSNGSSYSHPHAEAVARVIAGAGDGVELLFNYDSDSNRAWKGMASLPGPFDFRTTYPQAGTSGITVDV